MYSFLPEGPFTILYMGVMCFICALALAIGGKQAQYIAFVMLANWADTRLIGVYDHGEPFWLFVNAQNDLLSILLLARLERSLSVQTVQAMFVGSITCYLLHAMGLIGRVTMEAWADVPAYIALAVILGEAIHDGGNLIIRWLDTYRGRRVDNSFQGLRLAARRSSQVPKKSE